MDGGVADAGVQPPPDPKPSATKSYVTLARVEGYGNPKTGELWARVVPPEGPPEIDGVGGERPGLAHRCRGLPRLLPPAGGVRWFGQQQPGQHLRVLHPVRRHALRRGQELIRRADLLSTDCRVRNRRRSTTTPDRILRRASSPTRQTALAWVARTSTSATSPANTTTTSTSTSMSTTATWTCMGPSATRLTTGTAKTPGTEDGGVRTRNAPFGEKGLWDFGSFEATGGYPNQWREMWVYFKNGNTDDFPLVGFSSSVRCARTAPPSRSTRTATVSPTTAAATGPRAAPATRTRIARAGRAAARSSRAASARRVSPTPRAPAQASVGTGSPKAPRIATTTTMRTRPHG